MAAYQQHLDRRPHRMRPTRVAPAAACVGGAVAPIGGDWALPGPRALIDANPATQLDDPHHDYPAWDWLIPEGTPIYAVRGGTVATIRNWPHNWWTNGCGTSGGGDCDTCGVGVTIVDDTGTRWTYCHGSDLTITLGATVAAGQQILVVAATPADPAPPTSTSRSASTASSAARNRSSPASTRTPSASSRRHCRAQDAASEACVPGPAAADRYRRFATGPVNRVGRSNLGGESTG